MNLDFKTVLPVLIVIIPGLIAWGATSTTVAAQGEDLSELKAKVELMDVTARTEEIEQAVFEQKVNTMVTEQKAIKDNLDDLVKEMREANARAREG